VPRTYPVPNAIGSRPQERSIRGHHDWTKTLETALIRLHPWAAIFVLRSGIEAKSTNHDAFFFTMPIKQNDAKK